MAKHYEMHTKAVNRIDCISPYVAMWSHPVASSRMDKLQTVEIAFFRREDCDTCPSRVDREGVMRERASVARGACEGAGDGVEDG
jgi:hypothetical protein